MILEVRRLALCLAGGRAHPRPLQSWPPELLSPTFTVAFLPAQAQADFKVTLANDRISHTDYAENRTCTPEVCYKPCCNPSHPNCVCEV